MIPAHFRCLCRLKKKISYVEMDSDELVHAAYQKYHHIADAKGRQLIVSWPGTNIVYGCKVCLEMLSAGRMKIQPCYRGEHAQCPPHLSVSLPLDHFACWPFAR